MPYSPAQIPLALKVLCERLSLLGLQVVRSRSMCHAVGRALGCHQEVSCFAKRAEAMISSTRGSCPNKFSRSTSLPAAGAASATTGTVCEEDRLVGLLRLLRCDADIFDMRGAAFDRRISPNAGVAALATLKLCDLNGHFTSTGEKPGKAEADAVRAHASELFAPASEDESVLHRAHQGKRKRSVGASRSTSPSAERQAHNKQCEATVGAQAALFTSPAPVDPSLQKRACLNADGNQVSICSNPEKGPSAAELQARVEAIIRQLHCSSSDESSCHGGEKPVAATTKKDTPSAMGAAARVASALQRLCDSKEHTEDKHEASKKGVVSSLEQDDPILLQHFTSLVSTMESAAAKGHSMGTAASLRALEQANVTWNMLKDSSAVQRLRRVSGRNPDISQRIDALIRSWQLRVPGPSGKPLFFQCSGCQKIVQIDRRPLHLIECERAIVCAGCQARLYREDIDEHEKDCRTDAMCPGCNRRCTSRRALRQHAASCASTTTCSACLLVVSATPTDRKSVV